MGTLDPGEPAALRFGNEVGDRLFPKMSGSTVAIVGIDPSAFHEHGNIVSVTGERIAIQTGTGTLFRIGSKVFIITAAHVLEAIESRGHTPGTWSDDPPSFQPLTGKLQRTNEVLDVAVFSITKDVERNLNHKQFLSLADVDFSADLGDGWYFLHGLPYHRSHPSRDLITTFQSDFTYRTSCYRGPTTGFLNYDPEFHLVLEMSNESQFADDQSSAGARPELGGISGCSIWLGFSESHLMDEWSPALAKVAAVQTKIYTEKHVVQGTRWAAVAMVIWKHYPGLRNAMRKFLPPHLVTDFESVVKQMRRK